MWPWAILAVFIVLYLRLSGAFSAKVLFSLTLAARSQGMIKALLPPAYPLNRAIEAHLLIILYHFFYTFPGIFA
jgi:hypothetical protein